MNTFKLHNSKNLKKIVIFMPNIEKGGIEKNLIILTNFLVKYFNIIILTSSISKEIKQKLDKKAEIIIARKRINSQFLNFRINNGFNSAIELYKYIRNKNNLLIFSLQIHVLAIIVSKLVEHKIVIRIANHPYSSFFFEKSGILQKIKFFIKNKILNLADGIICNSNSSKKFFLKNGFKKKIDKIFNPIEKLNKYAKKKKRKFNILSVGRLEKQKNIIGVIKAFEKIQKKWSNLKYIIIGSGSEELRIKGYIKEKNLQKKIILKGYINPQQELKYSKILILNSLYEGQPNILIESMNYNLPIISTKCLSGPDEILMNGRYGELVPVDDHEALSKKIDFVLKNYNRAITKSKKGISSLNRFNLIKQCKKYKNFLEDINYE